jgi:hypothetical protein
MAKVRFVDDYTGKERPERERNSKQPRGAKGDIQSQGYHRKCEQFARAGMLNLLQ